ncbi:MAG: nitroreductase family protein [Methanospirillaceae archaeon]|nr:nitroreductase family protein [Methanospirillaceae archaeon]
MTEITIDPTLCSGCGICVRTCPYGILQLTDDADVASVIPERVDFCSHCGHCSAICPDNAITISYEGAGPVPDLSREDIPTAGALSRLMVSRRSIREYQKKPVPQDILSQIFDIIRYAPTGMNGQSVHWLVVQDPKEIRELIGRVIDWARMVVRDQPAHPLAPILPVMITEWEEGRDRICHRAPQIIFASSHKDNPIGFVDAIIALTHLDLAAPVFGLGTCWAGILQIALSSSPELMESIGLPKDFVSHYAMMIGYPATSYPGIPVRNAASVTWR